MGMPVTAYLEGNQRDRLKKLKVTDFKIKKVTQQRTTLAFFYNTLSQGFREEAQD